MPSVDRGDDMHYLYETVEAGGRAGAAEQWGRAAGDQTVRQPVRVQLLGPLQVRTAGRLLGWRDFPGRKPKQLLAALLCQRGHVVSKERLAWLLWGENLPRDHVATLETYVSVLRRTLDPTATVHESLIRTEHRGYRIDPDSVEVDVDVFDALLAQAAGADAPSALALLHRALALVRGEVLEDEADADWAHELRDRYRDRHVQALVDAGRLSLVTGDPCAALALGQSAVHLNPLAEPAYQVVMLAAYALWRQDEALAAFDRCRRLLADELGADPLDGTVTLHLGILRHVAVADLLCGLGAVPQSAVAGVPAPIVPGHEPVDLPVDRTALPLLDREGELAALEAAMERARSGRLTLAVVAGGLGTGKTRLVEELLTRVDVPVASTRCSDLETDFSYLPMALALHPLLAQDPGQGLPGLHRLVERAEKAQPFDQFARLRVMEDFAAVLAAHPPLVLWLDDAQWADPETVTTLGYLQRRCPDAPLLVVLTCDRSLRAAHVLRGVRPDVRLELGLLSPGSLGRLGAGVVGEGALFAATRGHPLFVEAWLTARRDGLAQDFPAPVCERVLAACWDLGPQAYRLLGVVAALDEVTVDPESLAGALEVPRAAVEVEIDRLVELGWLAWVGEQIGFVTPAVRSVLLNALSPGRRSLVQEHCAARRSDRRELRVAGP